MRSLMRRLARRFRSAPDFLARRGELAAHWLRGDGLEIGALHAPVPLPPGARARYVDRLPVEQLRAHYPELAARPLVSVDVIDDGERLASIPDASQDFVVACHFLEHAQDPIGVIATQLRVLKPGSALFLAVPDRRRTFDRRRPPTSWEHAVRDHRDGPAASYEEHLREWAELVCGFTGAAAEACAAQVRDTGYSIHFHAWDPTELAEFLARATALVGGARVAACEDAGDEVLAVIERP